MERFRIGAVTFFASTEAMGLALGTEVRSSGKVLHSVIKRVQEHQEAPGIRTWVGGPVHVSCDIILKPCGFAWGSHPGGRQGNRYLKRNNTQTSEQASE